MDEVYPAFELLEDQLYWYDSKSKENRKSYKQLKVVEIFAATIIPFAADFEVSILTGIFGVLIVIFIGIQSFSKYHYNWMSYGSTDEQLKHKKYLFLSKTEFYKDAENMVVVLAERIESLISKRACKIGGNDEKDG
jgi:hypothetical protein